MIDKAHILKVMTRLPEIEAELSLPETAANQKRFRELVREHAQQRKVHDKAAAFLALSEEVLGHRELLADDGADPELRDLAQDELEQLESTLEQAERDLTFALVPHDPTEARNAVMEIRAGTGGDEAALFAGDLYRMYCRFCENRGWKIGLVDASTSEVGGYKEIVFIVEGEGAYGMLQFESGGHRVQRVPVTEAQGRIHTSAATVAVFPEADEEDDLEIDPADLRIDIFRASGAGGQHVNTTDSAVRIIHLPTGTVVQSQDERSQHRNKEKAMAVLKSRILDHMQREEAKKKGDARRSLIGSGDRSERIRTYNFPQNRLTDHRINFTLYSLDRVMEGGLDELLNALRDHDIEQRLDAGFGGAVPR